MTLNWNMRQGISATLWIYRRRVLVARKQIVQIELLCCLLLHSQGICWHITLYALPHLMPRLLLHLFCSASFFTLVARLFLLVSLICFVLQLPQFSCLCLTLQSPLPPSFTALPLLCPAHDLSEICTLFSAANSFIVVSVAVVVGTEWNTSRMEFLECA